MDTSVLIRCTIATTTQASFISSAVDCSATEWCDCIELASTNMDTTQGSQCNEPTEGLGCCSLILQEKTTKKKKHCNKRLLLCQPCKTSALFGFETTVAGDCEK